MKPVPVVRILSPSITRTAKWWVEVQLRGNISVRWADTAEDAAHSGDRMAKQLRRYDEREMRP